MESSDSHIKQELHELELNNFQKIQATNAIKKAFPNARVERKTSGNERVTFYKGVALKSFTGTLQSAPSTCANPLQLDESPELVNLKELLYTTSNELESVNNKLNNYVCHHDELQKDVVTVFLQMQSQLQQKIQDLQNNLATLLQKEVDRLLDSQSQCESLCAHETMKLNQEMDIFISYLNKNIDSNPLSGDAFTGVFSSLAADVRQNCPLLFNILDTILLHKKDCRKVSGMREKCAVHSLAILVSLRSQKIPNDFKMMITFLCISFGAGLRFISMLNHLGLTVS